MLGFVWFDKPKQKISWSVLHKFKTADEIAAFLEANWITGVPGTSDHCALAEATGWSVGYSRTCRRKWGFLLPNRRLTKSERNFTINFDAKMYPNLIKEVSK